MYICITVSFLIHKVNCWKQNLPDKMIESKYSAICYIQYIIIMLLQTDSLM